VPAEKLNDMAPGAQKEVHIICVPMPGQNQTCHISSATVLLDGKYHIDANHTNDWAASWFGK
jgi:hypothetical protein